MYQRFSLVNKTRMRVPALPLRQIKDGILGKGYSLSVAYLDAGESKRINKQYRGKGRPANVLSFSLGEDVGEIILCPSLIKKDAILKKNSARTFRELLGYLVIHGMLHLKGMTHSAKMERSEELYVKKYFNRNRYRNAHDQSRSRRIP